ncbi:unnamed protein product [Alternaria alternata]
MSAQRIGIFTIDFPDPLRIDYDNNQFITLNDSVSFQYRILNNIQTLSTKGVDGNQDPYGILYVPDVYTSGCKQQEADYVLENATRIANLPSDKDYALIAVAPWYSAQCTIEYFTAARNHPTKAFLTYLPGDSNAKPPVLNDAAWNLQDGGSWQTANDFPTYALSSMTGRNIMEQLDQYSGNLSQVPHADQLSQIYDSTDYVRLWATVSTDSGGQLPSLWVFLVIVLAVLLVAVSITSLVMHIIQRRRRNDLRERVLNGQVDLEALGVKRLTVSQQVLDKLPIHTHTAPAVAAAAASNEPEKTTATQAPNHAHDLPHAAVDAETGYKGPQLLRHSSAPTIPTVPTSAAAFGSLGNRIGGAISGRRIFSAPERTQSRPHDIEMATTPPPDAPPQPQPASAPTSQNPQDCSPTHNRREWARQRALAMLGPRHAPASDVEEEEENVPKWRRVFRKVFPI